MVIQTIVRIRDYCIGLTELVYTRVIVSGAVIQQLNVTVFALTGVAVVRGLAPKSLARLSKRAIPQFPHIDTVNIHGHTRGGLIFVKETPLKLFSRKHTGQRMHSLLTVLNRDVFSVAVLI